MEESGWGGLFCLVVIGKPYQLTVPVCPHVLGLWIFFGWMRNVHEGSLTLQILIVRTRFTKIVVTVG